MRVAFTGAHRVGKSTLVEAVAERLRGYEAFEEPYRVLEDEGYEFSDPPTVEDFERQLHQSVAMISEAPSKALFDRCPLDFVAYAQAIDDSADIDEWVDAAREALHMLDLVVFVPIETPDRVAVEAHEDRALRGRVDERLRSLILDDALGLGIETLEVTGTIEQRLSHVFAAIPPR